MKVKDTLGACVDTLRQAVTTLDQLSVGVQWELAVTQRTLWSTAVIV